MEDIMHRYIALAALAAATVTSAHAGELAPYGGESIALGSMRGVTYYTTSASGYRVVTTLADGASGLPVRFETTLADKQKLKVSVPGKFGEKTIALEIARAGDKVFLSRPQLVDEGLVMARPQAPTD
jgi:hypothetical protein